MGTVVFSTPPRLLRSTIKGEPGPHSGECWDRSYGRHSTIPIFGKKAIFDADSVAGDLWMRQHYHEIHLELEAQEANAFLAAAQSAGLILDAKDTDLAH